MNKWLQPIILQGHYIELKPIEKIYAEDLVTAAADGKLWDIWYTTVPSEHTVNDYIADALQERDKNLGLPFVIIH